MPASHPDPDPASASACAGDETSGPPEPPEQAAPADRAAQAAPGDQAAQAEAAALPALSDRDRAVLGVERHGWPGPGAKERAIRERLGISPTRYYQLLSALLDDPRALEHDPVTVNRLRRIRTARREQR